ncbi:MAG: DUF456 domain-containing protein [Gammaproteobacteria bacterium]|nr:MAG: DUF456 domain-containing protein [Gammaproteobacteria bacterium]
METALLLLLGALLVLAGLAGLLFPAIPGAPLLFLGLVLAAWAEDFAYVGTGTLSVLAVLALSTYAVDLAAGAFGARRFGASPRAMLGAAIGALLGIFFGLPGVVLGPFAGACAGELTAVADLRAATRAGLGATLGLVLGAALKIALAFVMLGLFAFMRLAGG